MQIVSQGTILCREICIPSPSGVINVPNIVTTITLPEGFVEHTAPIVSHGSYSAGVWTIPQLPAGEDATINICFTPSVECPTGKTLTAAIDLQDETNLGDNEATVDLEYITCCEIAACLPEVIAGENIVITEGPNGETVVNGYGSEIDPNGNLVLTAPDGTETTFPAYLEGENILFTVGPNGETVINGYGVTVLSSGELEIIAPDGTTTPFPAPIAYSEGENVEFQPDGAGGFSINSYGVEINGDGDLVITAPDGTEDTFPATEIPVDGLVADTTGGYTHTDNQGGAQKILFEFDESRLSTDGEIDLVDSEGTVVDTLDICTPNCPPIVITVDAADATFGPTACGTFRGQITGQTPCSQGQTIYSIIPNTSVNGIAQVGQAGDFEFNFTDCSVTEGTFLYLMACEDGTTDSGMVTIELTQSNADAIDDSYAAPADQTLTGDVSSNDVPCTNAAGTPVTTYELNTPPTSGVVTMTSNGQFSYNSSGNAAGQDSFTYNILCDGVITDTATVDIITIEAQAYDDYAIGVKNMDVTGDASVNDLGCFPGVTTTTFQWVSTTGVFGGTVTGTPDAFTYTPPTDFCGADALRYEVLCDGVVFSIFGIMQLSIAFLPVTDILIFNSCKK